MPNYSVNGQQIHVHEEGPPKGKAALLVHGWSSAWFAFSPLLPWLRERYRCYAVDLPGYGESPGGEARATIPRYADWLAELICQISRPPVVYIGHSMGGMIGLTLLLRHPGLIERFVLLCPTISGRLSLWVNLTLSPFVILDRFPLTNTLVTIFEPLVGVTDRLLRPALFAEVSGVTQKDYEQLKATIRRRDQGRVRAECFWAMRQNDLRGQLGKIDAPSLVIWGMEDNIVPLYDASAIAREWPDADLRVIPNAGHWPQFETPETTNRYIRAFLSTPLKLLKVEF